MAKKNLANIAKGGKGSNTKAKVKRQTTTRKKPEKVIEKVKSPEEKRDIKAKKTVEKLLEGVSLIPNKDGITGKTETDVVTGKTEGKEWLEEQVGLLSEQVELLRSELGQSKEDYTKIYQELQNKNSKPNDLLNETLIENVLAMFNELQNNMTGRNPERTPHDIVKIDYLLKQMILFFPFTEQYKKF